MVETAIRKLPAIYREAFVLRDVEEIAAEEAAEATGITVSALKSRLLRARLLLRESLAASLQEPAALGRRMFHAAGIGISMADPYHARDDQKGNATMGLIDCQDVLANLSAYIDGEGSAELRRALEEHIAHCRRCRVLVDTTGRALKIVLDADP